MILIITPKRISTPAENGWEAGSRSLPKLQRNRPKKSPKEAPNLFCGRGNHAKKKYQHNMSKTQKIYTLRMSWYVMVCPKKGIILRFHSYFFSEEIWNPILGRGLDSIGICHLYPATQMRPTDPPDLLGPFRFTA